MLQKYFEFGQISTSRRQYLFHERKARALRWNKRPRVIDLARSTTAHRSRGDPLHVLLTARALWGRPATLWCAVDIAASQIVCCRPSGKTIEHKPPGVGSTT